MTIIALSGEIGAGKDTFGDILADRFGFHGYTAHVVKFAQPLKQVIERLGIPDSRELKEKVLPYFIEEQTLYDAIECVFQYMSMQERQALAKSIWSKLVACHWETIWSAATTGRRCVHISPRQFQQWLGMGAREIRQDYFIHHLRQHMDAAPGEVFIVTDGRFLNERELADTGIHIKRPANPCAVSTNDASEKQLAELERLAEFLVHNEEREDWQDCLEHQADTIINLIEYRGYADDAENSGATGK